MKRFLNLFLIIILAAIPKLAIAFENSSFKEIVLSTVDIISFYLVTIIVGLTILVFFWGLAVFIYYAGSGDDKKMETGKQLMKWGIIGLFVMLSIWGIVELFSLGIFDEGVGIPSAPIL